MWRRHCGARLQHLRAVPLASLVWVDGWVERVQAAAARQAVRQCTTGLRPLDSFFPFDPYLLARSVVQLVPPAVYIRWGQSTTLAADGHAASLRGGDEDDDEEDMHGAATADGEDDEEESEDEIDDRAISQQYRSSISGNTPMGQSVASVEADGSMGLMGQYFGGVTSAYRPADGFAKPRALDGGAGVHAIPGGARRVFSPHPHSPNPHSHSSYERSFGHNSMAGTPIGSLVGTPMSCTPDVTADFHAAAPRR
jgi:hypothetical protein